MIMITLKKKEIGEKMHRARFSGLMLLLALVLTVSAIPMTTACGPPFRPRPPLGIRPIVFVHGGAGSGGQFESQAMRFTSNGYPANYIIAFDYDSSHYIENRTKVLARLDLLIDDVLEETGADKVDLIGHSYDGLIVLLYLNEIGHSAKVAHCVIVDSHSSIGKTAPDGVPTLALWGDPLPVKYPEQQTFTSLTKLTLKCAPALIHS